MSPSVMKLLAAVLLLLSLSACWAEVVHNFIDQCPQFFATPNGVVSPPTGIDGSQYKRICQTRNGVKEFATLYDTQNKTPVYSAYRYHGRKSCKRQTRWCIEPQLDDPMSRETGMTDNFRNANVGTNQALNDDYDNQSEYHKGHLAPVFHATSQSCSDATFTLTNAAPQEKSFNRRWFHYAEKPVSVILDKDCIKEGLRVYVVTGVVPGPATLNNRVRIPSQFWSAFCCLDNNDKTKHSGAYIGANHKDSTVTPRRVQDLEAELTELYKAQLKNNIPFTLFGGHCYAEIPEPKPRKRKCKISTEEEK